MNKMFQSATTRLTLFYVGLLTVVSLFFSYNWYTVATNSLDQNFLQQQKALRSSRFGLLDKELIDEFVELRRPELAAAKNSILGNIIVANTLFLVAAGVGSYFLAKRTLKPIEKAHRAQRRFTADASHELRTPIAAMQTEIEVALRDVKLTKQEAVALLGSNLEELGKLRDLSAKLLQIAREDEDGEIEQKFVSFTKISDKAIKRVQKLADGKNIELVREIEDTDVYCNDDGIVEVLVILIENAIKYSPEKSEIRVIGAKKDDTYRVEVADTGRGLKESDLHRIFERFYRVDQSRNKKVIYGNGLGLSLAQTIASKHETEITASSKGVGQGSVFSFELNLPADDKKK